MYRNISIVLIPLLALSFYTLSAHNIDLPCLDRYLKTLESHSKFMGSVSIFHGDTQVYSKSVGYSDVDNKIKADEDTKYCIGSISKTFTAVMVFQAIEAGKLSLSDTLDEFFPQVANSDVITIADMLSHRSGIHNFTADEDFYEWHTDAPGNNRMVEIITGGGSDFEPGTETRYSNSNYVLLTYILEYLYGKPYGEILQENIAVPLSLENTYFDGMNVRTGDDVSNSYKFFDRWRIERRTHPSITSGAGAIQSTPKELNIFADALFSGKLLSESSLSVMKTIRNGYGMGLLSVPFHDKRGYGHSGGIDGFNSMLIYMPEDRISYAVTSNGLNYTFNDIHVAALSAAYRIPFDVPDFDFNPELLDSYTGIYSCDQLPLKLTVRRSGDSLEGQGTGQPPFPLEPVSAYRFKSSLASIVMEFDPDRGTMVLRQGGGVFHFKKE